MGGAYRRSSTRIRLRKVRTHQCSDQHRDIELPDQRFHLGQEFGERAVRRDVTVSQCRERNETVIDEVPEKGLLTGSGAGESLGREVSDSGEHHGPDQTDHFIDAHGAHDTIQRDFAAERHVPAGVPR